MFSTWHDQPAGHCAAVWQLMSCAIHCICGESGQPQSIGGTGSALEPAVPPGGAGAAPDELDEAPPEPDEGGEELAALAQPQACASQVNPAPQSEATLHGKS